MFDQYQFRRLALFVGFGAAVVFGGLATKANIDSKFYRDLIGSTIKLQKENFAYCREKSAPEFCELAEASSHDIDSYLKEQEKIGEKYTLFRNLAIAIPISAATLFYGMLWVVTGQIKTKKAHANNTIEADT